MPDMRKAQYYCTKCGRFFGRGSNALFSGCRESDCPVWKNYKDDVWYNTKWVIAIAVFLGLLYIFLPSEPKVDPKPYDPKTDCGPRGDKSNDGCKGYNFDAGPKEDTNKPQFPF